MRLHLHKLDSDHEGLLRVRPVQLLGGVADLGDLLVMIGGFLAKGLSQFQR